jgi:hypothetical protein
LKLNFILFLLIISTSILAQTATAPALGDGTENHPYQIETLENLYWITANNDVVPTPDQQIRFASHYIQTANINASETTAWFDSQGWLPIAISQRSFTGSYNGAGNSIDGLVVDRSELTHVGLFGSLSDAEISNLTLNNVHITGASKVGALIGAMQASLVNNCTVGAQSIVQAMQTEGQAGGIVGECNNSGIINSDSYSEVIGPNFVGGLIGYSEYSSIENSGNYGNITGVPSGGWAFGGLVGEQLLTSIKNSFSKGEVSGDNAGAGIAGFSFYSSIGECFSEGYVSCLYGAGGILGIDVGTSIRNSSSSAQVDGHYYAGGLVGFSTFDPSSLDKLELPDKIFVPDRTMTPEYSIKTSYASGEVSGYFYLGGLVGYLTDKANIENCYSRGSVLGNNRTGGLVGYLYDSIVTNSYSVGYVEGEEDIGGLIGLQEDSQIINSYWDMDASMQNVSSGGEGRTTAELTYPYAANTYLEWDFDQIWSEDSDHSINDGYPYLLQSPVSADHLISIAEISIRNYPNPFNPQTTIEFSLHQPSLVEIRVFNTRGQFVRTLASSEFAAGEHQIVWNGRDEKDRQVASGVYLYHFQAGDDAQTKRMLFLK